MVSRNCIISWMRWLATVCGPGFPPAAYSPAPNTCLEAMVLVKLATVIHWHRQGFRLYWRWRSRSGRPSVDREVRKLVREMSSANPLWGAPRVHATLALAERVRRAHDRFDPSRMPRPRRDLQ